MSGLAFKNAAGTFTTNVIVPEPTANTTVTLPATGTVATVGNSLTLMTAQNSTSGTSIDFTGIPSWAKRITVMFNGVSTNGTSNLLIQLGTSGGVENSGYVSTSVYFAGAALNAQSSTNGILIASIASTDIIIGKTELSLVSGTSYVASGLVQKNTTTANTIYGNKTLSTALDRIRITTVNGTDTFDSGSINVMYEG